MVYNDFIYTVFRKNLANYQYALAQNLAIAGAALNFKFELRNLPDTSFKILDAIEKTYSAL